MPIFTIPIHESNDCHTPGGRADGGQFCSDGSLDGAQYYPAGANVPDLHALAQAGDQRGRIVTRRMLFNPKTGEFIVGTASGRAGREQSHAEAFDNAIPRTVIPGDPITDRSVDAARNAAFVARGKQYDQFAVHGHLQADTPSPGGIRGVSRGPLTIEIDRLTAEDTAEQFDGLMKFFEWAITKGATRDTPVVIAAYGPWRQSGKPLGKLYPSLFPKAARRKAA